MIRSEFTPSFSLCERPLLMKSTSRATPLLLLIQISPTNNLFQESVSHQAKTCIEKCLNWVLMKERIEDWDRKLNFDDDHLTKDHLHFLKLPGHKWERCICYLHSAHLHAMVGSYIHIHLLDQCKFLHSGMVKIHIHQYLKGCTNSVKTKARNAIILDCILQKTYENTCMVQKSDSLISHWTPRNPGSHWQICAIHAHICHGDKDQWHTHQHLQQTYEMLEPDLCAKSRAH